MIQAQKFPFEDFSGGITENFISGQTNAYRKADNLWVTRNKTLQTRPGSVIYGSTNYNLPNGASRVNALINFYNDTALYAISGRDFFYQNSTPSWVPLLGPAGNSAFTQSSVSSKFAWAEYKQTLFLTSDAGDSPQKIYTDQNGVLQLRQAGLPIPVFSTPYTTDQLFNAAVALALEVRNKMIAHFSDSGTGNAHLSVQSTSALSALTQPGNTAALLTYVATLTSAYATHVADALRVDGGQVYHLNAAQDYNPGFFAGRFSVLNLELDDTIPTPTDLNSCVATLNDLRNKFNWHTYATITHGNAISAGQLNLIAGTTYTTNTAGFGLHAVVLPTISNSAASIFSGQAASMLTFVNNLKAEYNEHLSFTQALIHNNTDSDNLITVPDATDLFSAIVILNHLEFYYWFHYLDAVYANESFSPSVYQCFTGTSHNGTATFTSTSINGSAYSGYNIINAQWATIGGTSWAGQNPGFFSPGKGVVSTGTSNTVVFSTNYTGTTTSALTWCITTSNYHYDYSRNLGGQTSPITYLYRMSYQPSRAVVGLLDYSLQTMDAIGDEAVYLAGLLKGHQTDGQTENTLISPTFNYYFNTGITQAAGTSAGGYRFNTHNDDNGAGITWPLITTLTIDKNYYNTAPTVVSYLYTAVWRYNYQVGLTLFENDSTPSAFIQVNGATSPKASDPSTAALYPITLTNLPVLKNNGTNYDTSGIVLDIYRTIGNGSAFFLVGTVSNGTTSLSDSVLDATLLTNQEIYTTGGVVNNDPPPQAKFIHILNGTAYYGWITDDTGQQLPFRVQQSIQNQPDSCPGFFFDDLDDEVTGLTSWRNYIIAMCKNSFYRLEGTFNELGQGAITHAKLSDSVGCVAHSSIVRTEFGIFFAGTNGIYFTDGYSFTRVTTQLENTYAAMISTDTQKARISGAYMKDTRRVVWTMMSNPNGADCDVMWVLDLNWGIKEMACFTTWSGGPGGTSFRPSAVAFFRGQLIRGDARGYILKHDMAYYSDPFIDTTVAATNWRKTPIIYDYQSVATDFGSPKIKKWVTKMSFQGKNESNLSMGIFYKSDNDKGGWQAMKPVRFRGNCVWGDPTILWGDATTGPNIFWDPNGMIDTYRRMPAGSLRCNWKQIRFTNANVVIANSDTYGTANSGALSGGLINLTFTSSNYLWPLNAVGNYTISFSNDGYVDTYAITANTGTQLTISDPNGTAPASTNGLLWTINGIPVDERVNIYSFDMTFGLLGDEKQPYQGATSTDGGAN